MLLNNVFRIYGSNLNSISVFLKAYRVKGVFVLQPLISGKKIKTEHESYVAGHKNNATLLEAFEVHYPKMKETMERIAFQNGIFFSDFRQVFNEEPRTVYDDEIHQNKLGQKILGTAFFERFSPLIYSH